MDKPPSDTTASTADHMSIPPLTFAYRAYRLPISSSNLPFLAGKYAALSARALTSDPSSFGVHYTTEGSLSFQDYLSRLSRPNIHVFIVVAHPSNLPEAEMNVEKGAWVGMVTQIGPTPKSKFYLPLAGSEEPLDDDREAKFHQTGTWIDSSHRGKGLSKLVINAAVDWAVDESWKGDKEQVRVRAITGPANAVSKGLYGSLGFPIVGKCTINEAMRANGNEMYPFHGRTDLPEEMLNGRGGVVMEKVIRKREVANGEVWP